MEIFKTVKSLKEKILFLKNKGKTIGFVPTMGALHEGHISLINRSVEDNNFTVASLFVNPTQFNKPEDLQKYPRTFDEDKEKLQSAKCDILFFPSSEEMYPANEKAEQYDFGQIATVMEGEFRPGHFDGVAQIVSKLFRIVTPTKAYFGQKDFQQLAIVNNLNNNYLTDLGIEIIGCKIIREKGGLAMSSRNLRLNKKERENANIISRTLFKAQNLKNKMNIKDLKNWVSKKINENKYLQLEYFDIIDNKNLNSIKNWTDKNEKTACIAVYCGEIRLIDNVSFN